jgi:peptide/nickel transport system permease protein
MEIGRLVVRRLVQLIVVLLGVSLLISLLIRLIPGDPANFLIPISTKAQRAALDHKLGVDRNFFAQWIDYVWHLLHFDLGKSYSPSRPVIDIVKDTLPVSLQLIIYAQVLALAIAIPLGVLAAYRVGTKTDKAINSSSLVLLSIPNFVLALALSTFVGAKWKLFGLPTSGYAPGWLDQLFNSDLHPQLGQHFTDMVLPAFTLAVGQIAVYMRLLRSDMVATLQENFVTMAKAKGISNRRVLWRHALRPSSLTMLTVAGLNIGTLIGGAVVVEVIFRVPGMGTQIVTAILTTQYVELQSLVMVIALLFVLVNFAVDLLYAVLDPRIRRGRIAA